ncbi:hypothetical protein NP233_g1067 [Leucocoprinus birnbaumii]|uniref:Pyridoxamine 5'-phosphate oxidase putative domain-containing protein n=1 Tax=Leucocoprinus birnbaumii TaxID=56174 RepID=A0AAD5W0M9_9AGAR|nr:hypothetical protein NP233_g1067 [Leucocoprinus birnbaumii]
MFWVASAPLSGTGRVNVSPKVNEGTFHIIDENRVWYEDLTGSGVETISHLREPDNGRISILFHAFEGSPAIVRIYGTGTVYEYGTPEYDTFLSSVYTDNASLIDENQVLRRPGSRAIILVDILQVMTTCGWSVPYYEFKSYRTKLHDWAENLESHDTPFTAPSISSHQHSEGDTKSDKNLADLLAKGSMKSWWFSRNSHSIDGLPGLLGAFGIDGVLNSTRHYPGHAVAAVDKASVESEKVTESRRVRRSFILGVISGLTLSVGVTLTLASYANMTPTLNSRLR